MTLSQTLQTQVQGLRAVARADAGGFVAESIGAMDAEAVCAVASMAKPHLDAASSLLQLGAFAGMAMSTETQALYVYRRGAELIVALGEPTRSADAVLKKLALTLGEKF